MVGTAVFGAPRFCIFLCTNALFSRVLAKIRGAPKTAVPTTTHPIPQLTPSKHQEPKLTRCSAFLRSKHLTLRNPHLQTVIAGLRRVCPSNSEQSRLHDILIWKGLQGKNPEGKNFRKLLRRKQSSAKIWKISRNTLKSSKSDIFYLLRNLLKYLLRTFFSSAKFSEVFTLCVFTLWLFPINETRVAQAIRQHNSTPSIGCTPKARATTRKCLALGFRGRKDSWGGV